MRLWIQQLIIGGCLAASMTAAEASRSVDQIVSFGDSLSDNGNLYHYTEQMHADHNEIEPFPGAPYWQGRFCDGPVWVEELLKKLNDKKHKTTLVDNAVGGATVQAKQISSLELLWPGHTAHEQVQTYIQNEIGKQEDVSHHLYTFWMGANDYINLVNRPEPLKFNPKVETTAVVDIIKNDISNLIQDVHAKQILILNLPDLGRTPGAMFMGSDAATALTQMTKLHNTKLDKALKELQAQYPDVTFVFVDIFTAMNSLIDHHKWNGNRVKEVTFPCYGGMITSEKPNTKLHNTNIKSEFSMKTKKQDVRDEIVACKNPNDHLFWDWIHPTNRIHRMLAEQAITELAAKGIH